MLTRVSQGIKFSDRNQFILGFTPTYAYNKEILRYERKILVKGLYTIFITFIVILIFLYSL